MNELSADEEYWKHYTAIQKAKHDLLKRYLGGWFPILTTFAGRVLYVDSHAGKGRHSSGDPGSPIVAIDTLINHRSTSTILSRCEVHFLFLEVNQEHVASLQKEIAKFGSLPKNLHISVVPADYETELGSALSQLSEKKASLAPSFFFLDPYGFLLPMDLIKKILTHERTELLITFMLRYIDMAIANPSQQENLNKLFGTPEWEQLKAISEPDKRHEAIIKLYTTSLGAKFCSVLEMRGARRELKYVLIHATNHRRGREIMKESLWRLTPHGSFTIHQSDNPKQKILIEVEPDLRPLEAELLDHFRGQKVCYNELRDWALPLSWHYPHLNKVLRKLRDSEKVICSGYSGRFAFEKNPVIEFV